MADDFGFIPAAPDASVGFIPASDKHQDFGFITEDKAQAQLAQQPPAQAPDQFGFVPVPAPAEGKGTSARALAYGPIVGEQTRATMEGPLGALGTRDVAISPNMFAANGGPYQMGQVVNVHKGDELVGQYRVADSSWIKPGVPTFNTIELRDKDISGDRVTISPADQVRSDLFDPNAALSEGPRVTAAPEQPQAQEPQLQTAAPGVDIGVTPTPAPTSSPPTFTFKPRSGMQTDYDMARQAAQEGAVVQLPRAVIKQDDPITQKATKAAYNTVAGFAEGMESPEGVVSILNPFVGVATIGAVVPQLIQQVQAADKTPPGSPERWQAGANVTAFLAAPAVLHAIAGGKTNLQTTNQGGIDASTSSTQRAPGIETPLIQGVQGTELGVPRGQGTSSPAGRTRQGAKAGGKNRLQQGAVGVNRQSQQGLGGAARADRQSAPDNALAESATGLPPSGSPSLAPKSPSKFKPYMDIGAAVDRMDFDPNHSGHRSLADDLEAIDNLPKPLQKALAQYRKALEEDRTQYGERSGLPEEYGDKLEEAARIYAKKAGQKAEKQAAKVARIEHDLTGKSQQELLDILVKENDPDRLLAVQNELKRRQGLPLVGEQPAPSTFQPSAGAAEPAPPGKLWYQGVGPDNTTTWVTSNLEKAKIFAKRRGKGRINVYTSDQIGEGAFADNEGNLMSPEDYIRKQSEDTTIQTLQHGLGRVELPEPIQVLDSDGKPVAPDTPAPEPTKAKAETPAKAVKKVKAAAKAAPRDAGEIKAEIVARVQDELNKVSAEGGVTVRQSEYDPTEYEFLDAEGERVGSRVRIEETGKGKFTGTYKFGQRVAEKVTGDSREAVMEKLKAIHSEVPGTVTVEIPGDGTFTLKRNGKGLYDLLQRAKQIDVKTTPIKPEANLIRKGQNQGSSAEDIYATQLATTLGKDAAIADQEAQLKQVKPSSDAAKSIRKTIDILKRTDYAEPTPQAATQAGTPNFQATPAQLGVASPLPEFLNAAAQTVATGQGALKMGRLAQAIKETVRGAMNHTFPKLTNADRLSGELAARWVSSRAAAKYLAKVFSAKVVEGLNVDPAKFGAALTEDNLRSVRAGWQAAGDDVQAAQVKTLIGGPKSPFKTEAEYQAFLNEPAVKTAIERHKALWDQVIEPMYRKAMQLDDSVELPSRGLQTGARVNLFSPKDEPPGAPQRNMVQGVGQGNLTGTMRRKSPFGMRATGGGRTYNTNYHDMMANTYGRQLEVANKNAFENQLVDSGHAVIANVGERPTLPDGEETTAFPLKRTGIVIKDSEGKPRPMQVNRNIYVRKRLAGEYRAAANVDLTQVPWLAKKLTGGLNHAALAGLTDATVHIENLASALFTRPSVAGGALTDTLLSTFGRADVPVTITKAIVKSLKDNNEQLSQLAEIGALRPEFPTRNPGAKVIQWADKTTRLVLDDAYKKMVEQGLVEDTETNRREFVNQVGQYNRRAQNSLVRLGRDTGIAPFATAGTTFNALGIRTALMDPGVKATSMPAALALRANVLSKWVGGVTLVASINYLTTGKVAGRPGVPIGNIDTGKTDENGRPLSIPAFDLLGLGRAMRVTGARGAMTAYRNGLTPGDIVDATGRDIVNSQLAPWTGGPTGRVLSSVLNEPFGYGLPKPNPIVPPGDSQIASNLKQAFVHSNPILASAYARAQPGTSTLDALRQQIPRLVPTPSKGADFMAKYPLIVHKAQLNAYTNDLIYRARQLAPAAQQEFLDKAFTRIPKEDWPKTTKELFYRRIPYSPYSRQQAISAQ